MDKKLVELKKLSRSVEFYSLVYYLNFLREKKSLKSNELVKKQLKELKGKKIFEKKDLGSLRLLRRRQVLKFRKQNSKEFILFRGLKLRLKKLRLKKLSLKKLRLEELRLKKLKKLQLKLKLKGVEYYRIIRYLRLKHSKGGYKKLRISVWYRKYQKAYGVKFMDFAEKILLGDELFLLSKSIDNKDKNKDKNKDNKIKGNKKRISKDLLNRYRGLSYFCYPTSYLNNLKLKANRQRLESEGLYVHKFNKIYGSYKSLLGKALLGKLKYRQIGMTYANLTSTSIKQLRAIGGINKGNNSGMESWGRLILARQGYFKLRYKYNRWYRFYYKKLKSLKVSGDNPVAYRYIKYKLRWYIMKFEVAFIHWERFEQIWLEHCSDVLSYRSGAHKYLVFIISHYFGLIDMAKYKDRFIWLANISRDLYRLRLSMRGISKLDESKEKLMAHLVKELLIKLGVNKKKSFYMFYKGKKIVFDKPNISPFGILLLHWNLIVMLKWVSDSEYSNIAYFLRVIMGGSQGKDFLDSFLELYSEIVMYQYFSIFVQNKRISGGVVKKGLLSLASIRSKFLREKNSRFMVSNGMLNYLNYKLDYNCSLNFKSYKGLKGLNGEIHGFSVGYFILFKNSFNKLSRTRNLALWRLKQCLIKVGRYNRGEKAALRILKDLKLNVIQLGDVSTVDWLNMVVREIEPGLLRVLTIKRGRSKIPVPVLASRRFSISKGIRWLILSTKMKKRLEGRSFVDDLSLEMLKIMENKSVVLKHKGDLLNLILDSRPNIGLLKRTLRAAKRNNFGVC